MTPFCVPQSHPVNEPSTDAVDSGYSVTTLQDLGSADQHSGSVGNDRGLEQSTEGTEAPVY